MKESGSSQTETVSHIIFGPSEMLLTHEFLLVGIISQNQNQINNTHSHILYSYTGIP